MPNSLPIVDLSAQVSACSLILRLVVMPVERVHTHMAAPPSGDHPGDGAHAADGIAADLGVSATKPETLSAGLVVLIWNASTLVVTAVAAALQDHGAASVNAAVVGMFAACALGVLLVRENYSRSDWEQRAREEPRGSVSPSSNPSRSVP